MTATAQEIITHVVALQNTGTIDVPMLPDIAQKVLELAGSPDSSAVHLAKLIQSDQSLAGHVMHIANSAAYSPQSTLVSLQQAIARLGMDQVSDIALAASIASDEFSAPGYEHYCATIWRHALLTGLWAKEIARMGRRNVEAIFLCGLLHSVGRPLCLQLALTVAKKLKLSPTTEDIHQVEEELQQSLTRFAVDRWHLPDIINEAITYYPEYSAARNFPEQAATVAVAIQFANYCQDPDSIALEQLNTLPELAYLNLYLDDIEGLLAQQVQVQSSLESFVI